MNLGPNYVLDHEPRNWVLSKRITRKQRSSGTEYAALEIVGYYSSLENAAHSLYEKELEGVKASDLMDLIEKVESCKNDIVAALKEVAE